MVTSWAMSGSTLDQILSNLLSCSNLLPAELMYGEEHLWSLCVEVQFYILAAAICPLAGASLSFRSSAAL